MGGEAGGRELGQVSSIRNQKEYNKETEVICNTYIYNTYTYIHIIHIYDQLIKTILC
jgi:hypothetical protein